VRKLVQLSAALPDEEHSVSSASPVQQSDYGAIFATHPMLDCEISAAELSYPDYSIFADRAPRAALAAGQAPVWANQPCRD